MKKKISIIIAIVIAAIVAIILLFSFKKDNKIDAEERVNLEMEYVQNLSNFIEQVDIVTAAYSSAQIDKDAYKERNEVLKNEYFILKNQFQIWLSEHPVKTGTETVETKRAESAISNMQNDIDRLLDCTFTESGEPYDIYQLYYRYLEQKNKVKTDSIEYMATYKWLQNKEASYTDILEEYKKKSLGEEENAKESN